MSDKKIFISHSSLDAPICNLFEQLLVCSGIPRDWIVCSSVAGTHVPTGENLLNFLKDSLSNEHTIVFFLLSEKFYKSVICLNEMGATWVQNIKYFSILLNGFKRSDIKGCIDKDEINISLSKYDDLSIAQTWDLKRELENRFSLTLDNLQWQLGWNNLFDTSSDVDKNITDADATTLKLTSLFRMADAQGYCIGDDYREGCKVIKRCSNASKTMVQLDFSKTNSNICSLVYPILETNWLNLYRRPGARICFEAYFIADCVKELHLEIELHMNRGNNPRYALSLTNDTRPFEIPFTAFSSAEQMWLFVSEICFLFDRRDVSVPTQIIIENLQIK